MTRTGVEAVREIVKEQVDTEGLKPFSRRIGLPLGLVRSIKDDRDIGASNLEKACEALGLEFYIGPRRDLVTPLPAVLATDLRIGAEDYGLIARYEVDLSAGLGLIPAAEEEADRLAFPRAWLRRGHIDPTRSGIVRVKGDSMAPAIPSGALVLVHWKENVVEREGVYAFGRGGEAYIKRLLPVDRAPDGRPTSMVIIAENTEYPPEVVTGEALNELRIVGRVRSVLVSL